LFLHRWKINLGAINIKRLGQSENRNTIVKLSTLCRWIHQSYVRNTNKQRKFASGFSAKQEVSVFSFDKNASVICQQCVNEIVFWNILRIHKQSN